MILSVDVGGTNTRAALFDERRLRSPLWVRATETRQIESFGEWMADLMRETGPLRAVGIGVAGPVFQGRSLTVNLPWVVDAVELRVRLGLSDLWVLNDLEAAAYGTLVLEPEDWIDLIAGREPVVGNRAIIAAGTGLGEAGLYWDGADYHPFATEGGHASFSPTDDFGVELLQWLRRRFEHVSWERVLSGPGLKNVYDLLWHQGQNGRRDDRACRSAEEISIRAHEGRCPICVEALERFASLYGSEAANLALKLMAVGGVYIAGAVAVQNRRFLDSDEFRRAFLDKGRMRPLLEVIPVRLVLLQEIGLCGAAVRALRGTQPTRAR